MKRTLFSFLSLFCCYTTANAQSALFNPNISLLGNYSILQTDQIITSGSFKIQNKHINPGIEFGNRIGLSSKYYLNIGLRMNLYGFDTKTAGTDLEQWTWVKHYASIAIPISLGRQFSTSSGRSGNYFAGISAGMIECFSETGYSTVLKSDNYLITQGAVASAWGPFTPAKRIEKFLSIDIGAHYQPFKRYKRIEIGALFSYQVQKLSASSYTMLISETPGTDHNFDMTMGQRFINSSVMLTYKLGKQLSIR